MATIKDQLAQGYFVSQPGDIVTIKNTGSISSTVNIHFSNSFRGVDEQVTLSNKTETWNFLDRISQMPRRTVWVEEDAKVVKFEESTAYKARF